MSRAMPMHHTFHKIRLLPLLFTSEQDCGWRSLGIASTGNLILSSSCRPRTVSPVLLVYATTLSKHMLLFHSLP